MQKNKKYRNNRSDDQKSDNHTRGSGQEASKLMYQNDIGSIIILKRKDTTESVSIPIGIITERDIARIVGFASAFSSTMPVSEAMSKPLLTTTTSSS